MVIVFEQAIGLVMSVRYRQVRAKPVAKRIIAEALSRVVSLWMSGPGKLVDIVIVERMSAVFIGQTRADASNPPAPAPGGLLV